MIEDKVTIQEYRGVRNLVIAEVMKDDATAYETGEVKRLAGVAKITKDVESSTDTKYYDNVPALSTTSEGADTIGIDVSVLSLEMLAWLIGKDYDETTGAFYDGPAKQRYFAIGYITELTDGTERYVWRLKGSFAIPNEENNTKTNGTESNGQNLTYTGINTTHVFTKTKKTQKALVVDLREDKANVTQFFDTVTTCDTLQAKAKG